jgi:hypothetical protein
MPRNMLMAAVILAVAGALGAFWARPKPAEQRIAMTAQMLSELKGLKRQLTFGPSPDGHYTGVHDPVARAGADAAFASLIDRLIAELPNNPSKLLLLAEFRRTLASLNLRDTEDRERAAGYCERIMFAVGVKSSDGVLNRWLYGPILGSFVRDRVERSKT